MGHPCAGLLMFVGITMTDLEEEKAATGRFFFRKENRLLRRADFLTVYRQGRVVRRHLLHVFVLRDHRDPSTPDPAQAQGNAQAATPTRLGITVTRKAGNAVHRNRGRRLVREAFRHLLPQVRTGCDIVVNVMRAGTDATYQQVYDQLESAFRHLDIIEADGSASHPCQSESPSGAAGNQP